MNVPKSEEKPLLTVEEAGRVLGLGRTAAYNAVTRGDIPTIGFGRKLMVRTADIRRIVGLAP